MKGPAAAAAYGPGPAAAGTFFKLVSAGLFVAALALSGCGEHKQTQVQVPPPPPIAEASASTETAATQAPDRTGDDDQEAIRVPMDARPLSVETGMASWYGAPYHNRRGSNGEVYNMHAMTAAHRTLPLGSIVRVTNVKTGSSAIVRITDRGPFVEGRVLDLSLAAAKQIDVWQPGVAKVRVEVLQTPSPIDSGGRWAVQIGAFDQEEEADKLAGHLSQRYHTAKVQCFGSPVGDWWVRVRVRDDDRRRAEEVAHDTETPQGRIFLVRLD
jgi:rare lipoprotein A